MNNRLENHTVSEPGQQEIDAVRALFNAGRYAQAAPLARSMTERFPLCAFGWKALAATYTQLGLIAEALAPSQKLAALLPDDADAHFNLGFVLHELGRPDEAEASYRRALQIGPDSGEVHNNLGNTLKTLGRLEEAEAHYRRALQSQPGLAQAHCNLGGTLLELGRTNEAEAGFRQALQLDPDYAEAHFNLGNALHEQGRAGEAEASFRRALQFKPDYAEAHFNLGNLLNETMRFPEAEAAYLRALELKPDYAEAHNNCGNVLKNLKQPVAALASFDRAIALKPDYAEAYSNRGGVLLELDQPDEALASVDRAIALQPDFAKAHNNRGIALKDLEQPDAALASYERAIALQPDYADAHWNRALLHLLTGDFERGWEEYEWRWKTGDFGTPNRSFTQPLWLGKAALAGKTILLHSEQGYGDTLQFCRYAPMVADLGGRVILEAPEPLLNLFLRLDGVSGLVATGSPPPPFDYHCPLLSLPLAFKTAMNSIPAAIPYLTADASRIAKWRARLAERNRPHAGLVWSGSTGHKNDHNRSIPLSELAKILPGGFRYVSLQKELRKTDKDALHTRPDILHFGEELADFGDTAALCELMDVIVSVDTSVAHLAGALGRPLWILLPCKNPDWRWLQDRDDSPWYPSVKLYRQQEPGDWGGVLARVKADLQSTQFG